MPRKLAKNVVKGDLILMHDENKWLRVTDVGRKADKFWKAGQPGEAGHVSASEWITVLVWFEGDNIAVHYRPEHIVDYAQGGQVGQARKAGEARKVNASEWRRFMEITQYLDEQLSVGQRRSLALHLLDQLSAKDRAKIISALRHDQRQENRERGWPKPDNVQWEDPKLNPSTYVSMQTRIVGDKLKDSGELG